MAIHWNLDVACDNQLLSALTILNELILRLTKLTQTNLG